MQVVVRKTDYMLADLEGLVKFLGHVYGILESHSVPSLESLSLSDEARHEGEEEDDDEAPESVRECSHTNLKALLRETVETLQPISSALTNALEKIN